MPKPLIYIESSLLSYLAARPSREIVKQSRQVISFDFWVWAQAECDCCVSALTRDEIARGDSDAARRRLEFFNQCRLLPMPAGAQSLATQLIELHAVPRTEPEDAAHIAISTLVQAKYIASWNFAHIVGIEPRRLLERALEKLGYQAPILATPEEILLSVKL